MCEICRQYPVHPQCPNAEPILYGYCEKCGRQIYAGERICELDRRCILRGLYIRFVENCGGVLMANFDSGVKSYIKGRCMVEGGFSC